MAGNNVPGLDNPAQFTTQVPGVALPRRQEFTEQGQAFERLGSQVEGAAQEGGQIYDSIQQQNDVSTANLAHAQATVQHAQKVQQLSLSSPDGFVHEDDGSIARNSDGSQRTIAQQYWDDADSDYQSHQDGMSARGAAIFRTQMQKTIVENTQMLQRDGMRLQAQDSERKMGALKDTYSKDFDRAFLPPVNSYYAGQMADGSNRQYPSAQKFFDAVQATQIARQQMGTVQGRPGMYGAGEVESLKQGDSDELANNWLKSAKQDLIESNGSRAQLHNTLKDASSTSVMQIHSLLDVVNGRDPQSKRRAGLGLPTVNSSLSPDGIHKWSNELLSMMPAAKEVDKSEYELFKQQLGDFAGGVRNLDQFASSPLLSKFLATGSGLGLSDAERVKDMSPLFSKAVMASAISTTTGIASAESKRAASTAVLQDAQKRWPQWAQMFGIKDPSGFGEAAIANVSKDVAAKLQEDAHQMNEDPVKYMAGIQEGPQGPGGAPKYRSAMAHAIEDRLDPHRDPSLFAVFSKMSNGKSVLENAQSTMNNGYARMFNSKADVTALQKTQFEDQAKRIINSNDPRMITSYFKQLDQQHLTPAEKENYVQHLVHQGGLPQTYADALNLVTPSERETRWATLKAGPPPLPEGLTEKTVQQTSSEENKSLAAFINRKYGANSSMARTMLNTYDKSWQDDFKQAYTRNGGSESEAKQYANDQRDKTTGAIGIAGAKHDFFGTGWAHWGQVGPQVPVEFGSNKYTEDQKKNITDTLVHFQSKEALAQHQFVTPPGALPPNENAPSDAEQIANTASMWRRVGGGWRLQRQLLDKENRPTGNSQDVQVRGSDGKPHYYEVKESDALAGIGKKQGP